RGIANEEGDREISALLESSRLVSHPHGGAETRDAPFSGNHAPVDSQQLSVEGSRITHDRMKDDPSPGRRHMEYRYFVEILHQAVARRIHFEEVDTTRQAVDRYASQ